jgi:hypothetical protein
MSTWRCGWICPRSYFFAVVFLAGASFAVLLAGAFLAGVSPSVSSRPERRLLPSGQAVGHIPCRSSDKTSRGYAVHRHVMGDPATASLSPGTSGSHLCSRGAVFGRAGRDA